MKQFLLCLLAFPLATNGQTITTIAGTGTAGYSGDGAVATLAMLNYPRGVVVDAFHNTYIADASNNVVRKIKPDGTISTCVGNNIAGYSGDEGPATNAQLNRPWALAIDGQGNMFIADANNNVVRKVDTSGTIHTIAGNGYGAGTGTGGYSGDGLAATNAELNWPLSLAIDGSNNIYISDYSNNVVRKVSASGMITTIAGTSVAGYTGDNGPATAAQLSLPSGLAFDKFGDLFLADLYNNVIRKIDLTGTITTVIGNGFDAGLGGGGYSGDLGPATAAELAHPFGLAIDTMGKIYFSDMSSCHIRMVDTAGIIYTIAGAAVGMGYSGDGGPATNALMHYPYGICLNESGEVLIADGFNHAVRKISLVPARIPVTNNSEFFLTVFPNPATNALYVIAKGTIGNWRICNVEGRIYLKGKTGSAETKINIDMLPHGQYFLICGDSNAIKFIKQD
jgi:hypothetical protein